MSDGGELAELQDQLDEITEEYKFLEAQFDETSEALLATHKLFQQVADQLALLIDSVKSPEVFEKNSQTLKDNIKDIQKQMKPVRFMEVRPEHDQINSIRAKYARKLGELIKALDDVHLQA